MVYCGRTAAQERQLNKEGEHRLTVRWILSSATLTKSTALQAVDAYWMCEYEHVKQVNQHTDTTNINAQHVDVCFISALKGRSTSTD